MIYIDPPYNTGGDFVYKDNFKDNIQNYKKITGQVDSEGNATTTNREYSGRYHTDWLNMMYPRLRLARNLLKDDGIIFISIGDDELSNLKRICDEVFGEDNFIASSIWNCSTAGGIRPKFYSVTHEYGIVYAKNKSKLTKLETPLSSAARKLYTKSDENGPYREKDFVFRNDSTNKNQKYLIECPDGTKVRPKDGYIYRFIRDTFDQSLGNNEVVFKKSKNSPLITEDGKQSNWNIYIKKHLGEGLSAPNTIVPRDLTGMYNTGTTTLQNLFDGKRYFQNPKSVEYIKYNMNIFTEENDIVLDFFAGSSTTAQAV